MSFLVKLVFWLHWLLSALHSLLCLFHTVYDLKSLFPHAHISGSPILCTPRMWNWRMSLRLYGTQQYGHISWSEKKTVMLVKCSFVLFFFFSFRCETSDIFFFRVFALLFIMRFAFSSVCIPYGIWFEVTFSARTNKGITDSVHTTDMKLKKDVSLVQGTTVRAHQLKRKEKQQC